MDLENLGSGPDINAVDVDTLDFGNAPESPKVDAPEPTQEELEAEVSKANGKDAKTPEEEVEPGEKTEPARDDKGRFTEARIPKSRFDEQVGKERAAREAAERRAAELEEQLNAQTERQRAEKDRTEVVTALDTQVTELEAKYQDLLLDGNTAEAAKVMREIRMTERQIAKMEAKEESAAVVNQALEKQRFETAVARLEADYPLLNPESESYDNDLVQMVILIQQDMVRSGTSPSNAIAIAAKRVMERMVPKPQESDPKGLSAAKTNDRQQKAVEAALSTQKSQPASMKEVGYDSDTRGEKGLPDVSHMSADEFAALPKATQDRLMGNLV